MLILKTILAFCSWSSCKSGHKTRIHRCAACHGWVQSEGIFSPYIQVTIKKNDLLFAFFSLSLRRCYYQTHYVCMLVHTMVTVFILWVSYMLPLFHFIHFQQASGNQRYVIAQFILKFWLCFMHFILKEKHFVWEFRSLTEIEKWRRNVNKRHTRTHDAYTGEWLVERAHRTPIKHI